jgi:RNA-binding protein YhbY
MTVAKKKHVKRAFAQQKSKVCIGKSGTSQELLREIESARD